jgi:WD40 repeat protein
MIQRLLLSFALFSFLSMAARAEEYGQPLKESVLLDTIPGLRSLVLSSDNKLLALAGEEGGVEIWNIVKKARVISLDTDGVLLTPMRFVNDNKELVAAGNYKVTGGRVGKVCKWDVKTGKIKEEIVFGQEAFQFLSVDARVLITLPALPSKTAKVLDLTTKKEIQLEAEARFSRSYVCPQNKSVVSFNEHDVLIWDYPSGKLRHKIEHKKDEYRLPTTSFTSDGKLFHITDRRGGTTIWNTVSGKPVTEKRFWWDSQGAFKLFPDGKHCLQDSGLIWNIEKRAFVFQLISTARQVANPQFVLSDDGQLVAYATKDGKVSIWEIPKRK